MLTARAVRPEPRAPGNRMLAVRPGGHCMHDGTESLLQERIEGEPCFSSCTRNASSLHLELSVHVAIPTYGLSIEGHYRMRDSTAAWPLESGP